MVETDRLTIRLPEENDRARLVELFTDATFTVFSEGVHSVESAHDRFDRMLALAAEVPYAKQPIVEKATGVVIGYTGVGTVEFDGTNRLEWGWRLAASARGNGYATEATAALLAEADNHHSGEMLCLIHADNGPSHRVANKVGFQLWQRVTWPDGEPVDLLLRAIGAGGGPLLAPG